MKNYSWLLPIACFILLGSLPVFVYVGNFVGAVVFILGGLIGIIGMICKGNDE